MHGSAPWWGAGVGTPNLGAVLTPGASWGLRGARAGQPESKAGQSSGGVNSHLSGLRGVLRVTLHATSACTHPVPASMGGGVSGDGTGLWGCSWGLSLRPLLGNSSRGRSGSRLWAVGGLPAGCSGSPGKLCPFRHNQGEKMVVCKHWLRGLCKKGDQCSFLHEYDVTRMPECSFYSKFGKAPSWLGPSPGGWRWRLGGGWKL